MDFLSKLSFSDKKYAKNIEVQTYLVTRDQVAELFSRENAEMIQKTNQDLYGREVFLLVRCKNTGEYAVFGTLKYEIENLNTPITINIADLPAKMNRFHDCVIYMGNGFIPNNNQILNINYSWKELYKP